jgi:hypothetical protein
VTITNRVSLKSVNGGNTPIADVVDAPTIGTATAGTEAATVTYTAAATGGAATSFTAISTPGSITGTGASPITVSGLTGGTAYTFKVYGTNAAGVWSGVQSQASNSITPAVATSFESIATATVGAGGAATITFSNIPQTYTHLQIRCFARSTGPTNGENTYIYFNNTSNSTGYGWHAFRGDGASVVAGGSANARIVANVGSSNAANVYSAMIIDVLDYTNTNKNKTVRNLYGFDSNGAGYVGLNSTLVPQTAATTQIDIDLSYNFAQYSSFALYGIKG